MLADIRHSFAKKMTPFSSITVFSANFRRHSFHIHHPHLLSYFTHCIVHNTRHETFIIRHQSLLFLPSTSVLLILKRNSFPHPSPTDFIFLHPLHCSSYQTLLTHSAIHHTSFSFHHPLKTLYLFEQCCGSGMFTPVPNFFHRGPGSASKSLNF